MRDSQASKSRLLRRLLRYMQVRVRYLATSLFLVVLFLGAAVLPTFAHVVIENSVVQNFSDAEELDQQGRQFYQTERFADAVLVWQQALSAFQATGDELGQAMVLSNLSLAYQQIGQWDEAEESIQQAIALLTSDFYPGERSPILAQALDVQGRLYLSRGQAESAIETWQQAADIYTQLGDKTLLTGNQINQAQALQSLGFYRQAQEQLREVEQVLQNQPDSVIKVTGLRSLGNVLRVMGDLEGAQQVLRQSFAIAEAISDSQAISDTLLSLGDVARTQQDYSAALTFYQQAAETAPAPLPRISAQLRQFSLLLKDEQLEDEQLASGFNTAEDLFPQILQQLSDLPPSRRAVYARINLAESMTGIRDRGLGTGEVFDQVVELLNTAVQQARELEDLRAEAYALGVLGEVNERHQRWGEAENLTQEALLIAQRINVPDLAYRWQWQLGRLLKQRGEEEGAIAAYQTAVENLNLVRNDLLSVDSEVQFSFRDDVEPVYRELVELLITSGNSDEVRQDYLEQAIRQVNALQVSELENFLRCNLAIATDIPQIDPTAAIFYPIILPNQLAVILRLPETGQLQVHINAIAQAEVEQTLDQLRQELGQRFVSPEGEVLSQKVYDWLIRPFSSALAASNVETLVFVLDGALRNVPMAALHDGQQYLVEQYAIALTPSLQLFAPEPLTKIRLNALTFGLSEVRSNFPPHQNFAPLQNVEAELQVIQSQIPSEVFLNQEFTQAALQEEVSTEPFSIVHLATHGQFSSDPQQTFVLAWDGQINVNTLSSILQRRDQSSTEAIELLILSACQTADGDNRATLGLAGIAVRSGARSTIASLWSIDDRATSELISRFYQELARPGAPITRADALRRAQVSLIRSGYLSPLFWSPYVLVGNWL